MNLIDSAIFNQNIPQMFEYWYNSRPMPELIDSVTYNLYEDSNPFRTNFSAKDIDNQALRIGANTATKVGAEIFSAFANPFYLSHKIISIPTYYENAVSLYKNNSYNNSFK